jgi:hypothetical protein
MTLRPLFRHLFSLFSLHHSATLFTMICGLLLMSACTTPLQQIESSKISPLMGVGDALAAEYRALAKRSAEKYQWGSSNFFAKKGLRALKGDDVLPEDPNNWDLAENKRHNLGQARKRLMRLRSEVILLKYPGQYAKLQALYDCWLNQVRYDPKMEAGDECRINFLLDMSSFEYDLALYDISTPHERRRSL